MRAIAVDYDQYRPRYYGWKGQPITMEEWMAFYGTGDERRVAETRLPGGRWVSTVWLGLDHSFGSGGPPLIFETMAFTNSRTFEETACYRTATVEEAREAHAFAVMEMIYHDPPVKRRQLIHNGRKP